MRIKRERDIYIILHQMATKRMQRNLEIIIKLKTLFGDYFEDVFGQCGRDHKI